MIDFTPLLSKLDKPIFEVYPFLLEVKGMPLFNHNDRDRILHYMLLAYHPNSPMIEKYTSVTQRKEKSAEYAGFRVTSPRDQRLKEILFDHSDESFLNILHNFLIFVNNRTWSLIVSNETTFQEYQLKLITPLEMGVEKDVLNAATIKSKLMDEMHKIDERLDTYYHKLYMGDEKLITEGTTRKSITPESVASNVHKT